MDRATLGGVILTLVLSMTALQAFADQSSDSGSESKAKVEDVTNSSNTVSGQDVDEILTNKKLRAETGSKSRISISSVWNYNGGTIDHPFGDTRPNIQAVNGRTPAAAITGGVNLKYNITQLDSLFLGATVRMVTPLSSLTQVPTIQGKKYNGQKFDSYDPSFYYQHVYKLAGFQSYFQVGPTVTTRSNYTDIGYIGNVSFYNVNAIQLGTSKFTLGLESGAVYGLFQNPQAYPQYGYPTAADTAGNDTDWNLFAYPYLEYQINDRFNLRTVCMWFSVEHTLAVPAMNIWNKDVAMQSVGLGISVTRDIFLYPNVQFIPDQVRPKQTNVALEADISAF